MSPSGAGDAGSFAEAWSYSRRLILPLVLYKLGMLGLVALSAFLLPDLFQTPAYDGNFHWPVDERPVLASRYKTWDASYYLAISQDGYRTGTLDVAFFPLWPALIRAATPLTKGHPLPAALAAANLCSLAGLVLLHLLIARLSGPQVADSTLLLLLAFPGSLFFLFPYSESLFLLLSVLCLVLLVADRWGALAVVAFLLPMVRAPGVFILLPLAWACAADFLRTRRFHAGRVTCMAAPLAGYALYLVLMHGLLGDFRMVFAAHAQIGHALDRVLDWPGFLHSLVTPQHWHAIHGSLLDRVWFVWIALGLIPLARRRPLLAVYALPLALVPAMVLSFMAYTRFAAVVFPVFWVYGEVLSGARRQVWLLCTAALFFALQVIFLVRHTNFFWVA